MDKTAIPRRSSPVVMLRAFQIKYKPGKFAQENCVLVCRGACNILAATQKGKYDYILRLSEFETYSGIANWLSVLKMHSQSGLDHKAAMRYSDYYFQDSYRYARINQSKSTHNRYRKPQ